MTSCEPEIEAPIIRVRITGPCFSPDGSVLFVNVQHPLNMTLAYKGHGPRREAPGGSMIRTIPLILACSALVPAVAAAPAKNDRPKPPSPLR